jgi:hypothetical protein
MNETVGPALRSAAKVGYAAWHFVLLARGTILLR